MSARLRASPNQNSALYMCNTWVVPLCLIKLRLLRGGALTECKGQKREA